MADKIPDEAPLESEGFLSSILKEIVQSPFNSLLVVLILVLIYKIFKSRDQTPVEEETAPPPLPKLRRDFTPAELKEYSSNQANGRILVAINGNVFDVSKGRKFYGPGGPYANFAGHDATRGLATFSVNVSDNEYDDLSDLSAMEVESAREWEMQFREKYELVGRLLKRGEEPTTYSDDETESEATTSENKKNE